MLGSMAIIVFGSGYLVYLRYVDGSMINRPLSIKSDHLNLKLVKKEYHSEEVVQGYISFCKNRDVPTITQWNLIDTYLTTYKYRTSNLGKRCADDLVFDIEKIPKGYYPGVYHFEGILTYPVNPIHNIVYHLKTEEFHVIK